MQRNTKKLLQICLLTLGLANLWHNQLQAGEISGKLGAEARLFSSSPAYHGQEHHDGSLMAELEFYHGLASGSSITITPFGRLDYADSQRSHFDLREAHYLHVGDSYEITVGVSKVFWGSTEIHLIDIINQTDQVESLQGEEKLGQPMLRASWPRDWGTIDGFILPYFRERTGPGEEGRLRPALLMDYDQASYESGAEEYHLDFAIRYNHFFGELDFGLYQFIGTSREPIYQLSLSSLNQPILIPYYEQISQTGLNFSYVAGRWLLKGEALYRTNGEYGNFAAGVAGVEYTLVGIMESSVDLGLIAEYIRDNRDQRLAPTQQNDLLTGLRFAFNNAASTELLCTLLYDVDYNSQLYALELNHRLIENWKVIATAIFFSNIGAADPTLALAADDMARVELFYYF